MVYLELEITDGMSSTTKGSRKMVMVRYLFQVCVIDSEWFVTKVADRCRVVVEDVLRAHVDFELARQNFKKVVSIMGDAVKKLRHAILAIE